MPELIECQANDRFPPIVDIGTDLLSNQSIMPRSSLKAHPERHLVGRIGWLRAAVLGANDGIVSTATGAAIGAGAGAIAGSVITGIGTGAGAAVGAGVGGLIGSVIGTQTYRRDTRGYCYAVDQYGRVNYDYSVRC